MPWKLTKEVEDLVNSCGLYWILSILQQSITKELKTSRFFLSILIWSKLLLFLTCSLWLKYSTSRKDQSFCIEQIIICSRTIMAKVDRVTLSSSIISATWFCFSMQWKIAQKDISWFSWSKLNVLKNFPSCYSLPHFLNKILVLKPLNLIIISSMFNISDAMGSSFVNTNRNVCF